MRTLRIPVALSIVFAAGVSIAQECGAPTPVELYSRFQEYARSGQYAEMLGCLAPEQRAQATFGLLVASAFAVSVAQIEGVADTVGNTDAEEMATAFSRILETREVSGLDPSTLLEMDASEAAALLDGVDQAALVRDLMRFLETHGSEEGSLTQVDRSANPVLKGVTIDGDHALGLVDGEPVYFVKIDGLWYAGDVPTEEP